LGTLLAIGSGLLIVSLRNTMNAPMGFTADHVLVADFKLPPDKYQTAGARDRFFRGLRDELAPIPGVSHIAATRLLPLNTELFIPVVTEDSEAAGPIELKFLTAPNVTSDYFQAMGIPLREGRFFLEGETDDVAVVSESAARMLWPGENPIGRKIAQPEQTPRTWLRVVGVAGDVLSAGLDRPSTPAIYRSFSRYGTLGFSLVIRTAVSDGFKETLGRAVAKVDAEIPVPEIRTISELIEKSTGQRRFQTALFTVFALTAVLLATIGVYGVVAFSVLQRMREIGLRVALGADARDVMQLVFRYGMAPVVVGLVAGIGMASVFSKVMASLLFKASAFDPVIFIGAALVSACAGAVPCWLMSRRVLGIDPALCLRVE
jgi:putative ABC transport system permease protein